MDKSITSSTYWAGRTNSVQRIQNATGATYQQIEDALQRIIDDDGRENVALAKRIELIIDDNLMNGYKVFEGFDVPPNMDYIRDKQKIEGQGVKATGEDMQHSQPQKLLTKEVGEELPANLRDGTVIEQNTPSSLADAGGYADSGLSVYNDRKAGQIELPEIVEIAKGLNEGKSTDVLRVLQYGPVFNPFVLRWIHCYYG